MFCKHCGVKMNEDAKFCPACGESNAAAPVAQPEPAAAPVQPTPQPAPEPVQPTPAPQPAAQPPAVPSPFAIDLMKAIKGTFSKAPEVGVQSAAESKSPIWVLLLAVFALASGLALMFVTRTLLTDVATAASWNGVLTAHDRMVIGEFSNWFFVVGLIQAISYGVVTIVGLLALFAIFKVQVPFVKVANLVAGATMIYVLFLAAFTLLGFFAAGWAFLILLVGVFFQYVMMTKSIKTVTGVSGFWSVLIIIAAGGVAIALANAVTPTLVVDGVPFPGWSEFIFEMLLGW